MKKLITLIALITSLSSIAGEGKKKLETYEDLVKKEEAARQLEIESFEKEELAESNPTYIEVKDDAGYDANNMDKVREANHKAWDAEQKEFDKPWNNAK